MKMALRQMRHQSATIGFRGKRFRTKVTRSQKLRPLAPVELRTRFPGAGTRGNDMDDEVLRIKERGG